MSAESKRFIFYKPDRAREWRRSVVGESETEAERSERIRRRADEARPLVSMTPGQAETLRRAQRGL